jgi:hypothetical protein
MVCTAEAKSAAREAHRNTASVAAATSFLTAFAALFFFLASALLTSAALDADKTCQRCPMPSVSCSRCMHPLPGCALLDVSVQLQPAHAYTVNEFVAA